VWFACNIRSFITVSGLYELYVEADQPPCRRSQDSCSWGSYGGSPRRNSKGTEPRGSREFTTDHSIPTMEFPPNKLGLKSGPVPIRLAYLS